MENFEQELNKKLKHIKPSQSSFNQILGSYVTSREDNRYTQEKAKKLSIYQLINNLIMKKGLLIGLPVVLVVIVFVGVFTTRSSNKIFQNVGDDKYLSIKNNQKESIVEDNSSVDNILANFDNDINEDLISIQNEDKDIDFIMMELKDINNLKTNSYEDTI